MISKEFGRDGGSANGGRASESQTIKDTASDAVAQAATAARDAGTKAKDAAYDTAITVTDHFKDMLDKQISQSIGAAGLFASSIKRAGDDLDAQSPVAASIVRSIADRVEQFAEDYEGETVEQLTRSASDFTRRQPALVFGLAAFAGFMVFRAITSAPAATPSPSIRPDDIGSAA